MLSVLITRDMCNERKKCTPPGGSRLQLTHCHDLGCGPPTLGHNPDQLHSAYILISVRFPCQFRGSDALGRN